MCVGTPLFFKCGNKTDVLIEQLLQSRYLASNPASAKVAIKK
jgi:hypothetical protein